MGDPSDLIVATSDKPLTEADDSKLSLDDEIKHGTHKQSLRLRNIYAIWTALIATFQIVLVNLFFILNAISTVPGTGLPFHVDESIFKVFTVSVFASVIALALIVTRNLFPGEGFLNSLLGLFGKKD